VNTSKPNDGESRSTLAIIARSPFPLVYLDDELVVVAVSGSFCRIFEIDPAAVTGRKLCALGAGEWDVAQLNSLLRATADGFADVAGYEMDLVRHGTLPRRLVLDAYKLDGGNTGHVRVMLAIVDVTAARAQELQKDKLIKEKAVLLQEVQHRVANSLQIIASVLVQSARRVQSEEARGHLNDAHHRVMTLAAVQQQLAASSAAPVALRPYLVQLCNSLGASMISDPSRFTIAVNVDESILEGDTSICLGLIVTELVINALKHAFPNGDGGKIIVDYRSRGSWWILSVSDDGVGIRTGAEAPKPGLGTGIIEALSRQLNCRIRIQDAMPGTAVSMTHTAHLSLVGAESAV